MRIKNKLYCDYCGKFIRETTSKEQKQIEKNNLEGTLTNFCLVCGKCKYNMLYPNKELK